MDMEKVREEILKGKDIEDVLEDIDWGEFEDFCAAVFEEHDWNMRRNFRFKTKKRYEIDILANKGNRVLVIDCKHWGTRPGKPTQLRYAVEKQIERTNELSRIKTLDSIEKKKEFHPLIVTLLQEDITEENGVWIIPVFKLNNFLLEIDRYLEP